MQRRCVDSVRPKFSDFQKLNAIEILLKLPEEASFELRPNRAPYFFWIHWVLAISLVFIVGLPWSANAGEVPQKRLVVIDTGIDAKFPNFDKHIVHEVCIMFWYSCPNATDYQEGKGSATLSSALLTYPGFEHGTQMARVATLTNPNLEIVFIRIIGNNSRGARLSTSDSTVDKALEWIINNASKHNIGAVAMSQGHHNLTSGSRYCPSTPQIEKKIVALKQLNIPVFLPTGNSADKSRIDWPACIPASIAVGSVDAKDQISRFSNMDRNLTDFYVLGEVKDFHPDGITRNYSGTSVSAQVAAAGWLEIAHRFPSLYYTDIYALIRKSSPIVFDQEFRFGRKFDRHSTLRGLGQG